MKCLDCNKKMKIVIGNYKFKESGLDNISLVNIKRYLCNECGEEYLQIPNPDELNKLIAKSLIANKRRLKGQEIRFLRSYMGFSGAFFAKTIDVTRETISRWENGKKPVPKHIDILIRSLVENTLPDRDYKLHDMILNNTGLKFNRLKISVKRSGKWEIKEAA